MSGDDRCTCRHLERQHCYWTGSTTAWCIVPGCGCVHSIKTDDHKAEGPSA